MSIKNPLPGHQYGRSEPGYWYPRADPPPRRGRNPRNMRKLVSWLCVVLIAGATVDYAGIHHWALAAQGHGLVARPVAAPYTSARPPTAPATSAAPVPTGYPGAQAGDRPALGSAAVTVGGLAVAATDWVTMPLDGGQRSVCVTASITNRNAVEVGYGQMDWAIQSPTGDVHAPIPIVYDPGEASAQPPALTYGQLIAGGTTSGRVCFSDPGTAGNYVVSFRPEVQGGGRGIWLVRL